MIFAASWTFFFPNAYTLRVSHGGLAPVSLKTRSWYDEEVFYKYFSISKDSIKESFWIIAIILFSISDIFDKH